MKPGSIEKNPKIRKISIIGLGKLGTPMVAVFASHEYRVTGVDVDMKKVIAVREHRSPVDEPGVNEIFRRHGFNIDAIAKVLGAVLETDATFIVVATPSEPDGQFSLQYVLAVCEEIGEAIREKDGYHLVVLTSTVMPGATDGPVCAALERASGKKCGVDFGLCYNPEFIALGSVIHDFQNPDLVLIGESDAKAGDLLSSVYERVCTNKPPIRRMIAVNAELAKLAINTFVTTKISYANTLSEICEKLSGGDVDVVTTAIGDDSRIGRKYLTGGACYGGPCFPRDSRAFACLAHSLGVPDDIPRATDTINDAQLRWLIKQVSSRPYRRIGILGLTYKPGTDVIEESMGANLLHYLTQNDEHVIVYDPGYRADIPGIEIASSARMVLEQADTIVIATPWPEFEKIDDGHWMNHIIIDPWRQLRRLEKVMTINYVGAGLGA